MLAELFFPDLLLFGYSSQVIQGNSLLPFTLGEETSHDAVKVQVVCFRADLYAFCILQEYLDLAKENP